MIRALLLLVLTATAFAGGEPPGGWPIPPAESTVVSVYDGDTMTLASGDKVRLRWVNTPELKPAEQYGPEARAATEAFVSKRTVHLLLGSENPRDGYGRVVSGIQTDEGNLSIHLLEQGLAHLFVIPPDDTDLAPFIAAQERAKAARRGIWADPRFQGTLHITSFHANASGDDFANPTGEYLRVSNISGEPVNLDGYRIQRSDGKSWALPAVTVPVGHTFELHSGKAPNQTNPAQQLEVYLGTDGPIWTDTGDRATIFDRFGKVVDEREHEVASSKSP